MRSLFRISIFLLVAALLAATPLLAAPRTWTDADGNQLFNDPLNWSDTSAFDPSDVFTVDISGATSPNIVAGDVITGTTLYEGITTPGTVNMTGGALTVSLLRVGNCTGSSYFNFSGGTVTKNAGSSTRFGWSDTGGTGNVGYLEMSNNAVFNNINSNLIFGYAAGNTGYLDMTGGTLSSYGVQTTVGYTGTGHVTMSGNANFTQTSGAIAVGFSGGLGTWTMSDNTVVNALGTLAVGTGGTGTWTMSGNSVLNTPGTTEIQVGIGAGGNGTLVLKDNAQVIPATHHFITSVGRDGGAGTMTVQNNAQFMSGELAIGQNAGAGTLNVTGGKVNLITSTDWSWYGWEATLDIGRWGGTGTVAFSGPSVVDVTGRTNIGNNDNLAGGPTSNGALTLSGNATMTTHPGTMRNWGYLWTDGGDVYVGCNEYEYGAVPETNINPAYVPTGLGGVGALTVKDNASLTLTGGTMQIGVDGGTGTFEVNTTGSVKTAGELRVGSVGKVVGASLTPITAVGTMTLDAGTVNVGTHMRVGYDAGAIGELDVHNGTLNIADWFQIGHRDDAAGAPTSGTVNVTGGTIAVGTGGYMTVGWNVGSTGVLNQSAGLITVGSGICVSAYSGTGTINLNGGVLSTGFVQSGWNPEDTYATLNFNGGTLKLDTASTSMREDGGAQPFIWANGSLHDHIYVQNGGATVDSSGHNISSDLPFEADLAGSTGGLTKIGLGNFTIHGTNTYTGPTAILAGQLSFANATAFAPGTPNEISVATGAALGTGFLGSGSALAAVNVVANANVTFSDKSGLSIASDGLAYSTLNINKLSSVGAGNTVIVSINALAGSTPISGSNNVLTYLGVGTHVPTFVPKVDSIGTYDFTVADDGAGNVSANLVNASSRGFTGFDQGGAPGSEYWTLTAWAGISTAYPNGTDAKAWFTQGAYTGGTTYNAVLDTSVTLSSMLFDGGSNTWTVSKLGSNTITLKSSIAADSQIQVLSGSAVVNPDILMAAGDPIITVAADSSLSLTGKLSDLAGPASLTIVGLTGGTASKQAIVNLPNTGSSYSGPLSVNNTYVTSGYMPTSLNLANNANYLYTGTTDQTVHNVVMLSGSPAGFGSSTATFTVNMDDPTVSLAASMFTKLGGGTMYLTNSTPGGTASFAQNVNFSGGTSYFNPPVPTTYNVPSQLGVGWGGVTAGTATLKVYGSQTIVNVGAYLLIGRDTATANGTLILGTQGGTDGPTVNVGNFIAVGAGGGCVGAMTLNAGTKVTTGGYLNIGDASMPSTFAMHDNSSITVANWFSIGRDSFASGTTTYGGTGSMVMDGNSSLTVSGWTNIACWGPNQATNPCTGTLIMSGNSKATLGGELDVGMYYESSGAIYMTDNATLTTTNTGTFNIGSHTWAYGGGGPMAATLSVLGHASFSAGMDTAIVPWNDQSGYNGGGPIGGTASQISWVGTASGDGPGATVICGGTSTTTLRGVIALGGWDNSPPSTLTVNDSATVNLTGLFQVGFNWGNNPYNGAAAVTVNGTGAVVNVNQLIVGANGSTTDVWTQNAGHTTVATPVILGQSDYTDPWYGWGSPNAGGGTLQLNGGIFSAPSITDMSSVGYITHDTAGVATTTVATGGANGVVAFNGGTLQATGNNSNYITLDAGGTVAGSSMTLLVQAGGAVIDTNSYAVGINLPFAANSTAGGLTKVGAGTLTLTAANTYTGLTTVKAGTLDLGAPAFAAALNTAGTARGVDIQGGQLVLDYSSTGVSPVATVMANLHTSFTAGAGSLHSGPMFTSTGSAVGYGIGYVDDPVGMTVTAKVAVYGDATLDGVTDISDLSVLAAHWNKTGQTWTTGDFNYDGTVDISDLSLLAANWNRTLTGIAGSNALSSAGLAGAAPAPAVPEPGTLLLLGCGLFGLLAYAWRKRK